MSLWLLASASLVVIAAVMTGRVWLIWLAVLYASVIIDRFFWLAAQ